MSRCVRDNDVVGYLGLSDEAIDRVMEKEKRELERRERIYRGNRAPPKVQGRAVILVDDGLATGSTMRAAVAALRKQQPSRIVVAVPVAALEALRDASHNTNEMGWLLFGIRETKQKLAP